MHDGNFEVVGELLPGLIRLGTITSYDFDDSMEGYLYEYNAIEFFFGSGRRRACRG